MRHRKKTIKLGRTSAHRDELLASLVCHLIEQRRIRTTLAKAKAARSLAEKMVTLGKQGTLAARRRAIARLRRKIPVRKLFSEIAPAFRERAGGYTRVLKLGRRPSDSSEMALLEWVELAPVPAAAPAPEKKPAAGKKPDAAPAEPAPAPTEAEKPPAKPRAARKGMRKKYEAAD